MSSETAYPLKRLRIVEIFSEVANPRTGNRETHGLINILTIAVCAVICGADGWEEVEAWGEAHLEWLRQHLDLKEGIPSHDTFGRVFGLLDPKAFEACLLKWMAEMVTHLSGQQVCLDGKEVRRSYDRYHRRQAIQGCIYVYGQGLVYQRQLSLVGNLVQSDHEQNQRNASYAEQ